MTTLTPMDSSDCQVHRRAQDCQVRAWPWNLTIVFRLNQLLEKGPCTSVVHTLESTFRHSRSRSRQPSEALSMILEMSQLWEAKPPRFPAKSAREEGMLNQTNSVRDLRKVVLTLVVKNRSMRKKSQDLVGRTACTASTTHGFEALGCTKGFRRFDTSVFRPHNARAPSNLRLDRSIHSKRVKQWFDADTEALCILPIMSAIITQLLD